MKNKKTGHLCTSCAHYLFGCCPLAFFPSVKAQCSIYVEPGGTKAVKIQERKRSGKVGRPSRGGRNTPYKVPKIN